MTFAPHRIVFAIASLLLLTAEVSAELYSRAPDVLPGTTAEMRTTGYWIARMAKPDEVILTPGAIERMNRAYESFIAGPDPFNGVAKERMPNLEYWWPGHVTVMPDVAKMSPKTAADTTRANINIQIGYMRGKKFANAQAVEYSAAQIDAFVREMALDRLPAEVKVRPGIAVRYTRLRNVPSFFPEEQGISEIAKNRWDLWNVGILKIGKPVSVLHLSRSGEYLLVLCGEGYGWVRAEDIALGDGAAIDAFVKAKDFIVCTGDRVQLYTSEKADIATVWFGMGDCLPVASKSNPRMVKIPARRSDGSFFTETAWLAKDAEINVGWLPYTRRNVVTTAFRLLDNAYDWTGAWYGRQHETTYRDIFAVFGFRLPWHGGLFTFFGKNTEVMKSSIGRDAQYKMILEHEPFLTLESCGGHAQLFLGGVDGMPMVFDQHGYGYKDESGKELEIRRCCIGDVRTPNYFLTRNVTFLELK